MTSGEAICEIIQFMTTGHSFRRCRVDQFKHLPTGLLIDTNYKMGHSKVTVYTPDKDKVRQIDFIDGTATLDASTPSDRLMSILKEMYVK